MDDYGIEYDHERYHPDEEALRKLAMSAADAEGLEASDIRCPICSFRKMTALGAKSGIIRVKCPRCKFDGPMNLAYFRRMLKRPLAVKFRPERFGPDMAAKQK